MNSMPSSTAKIHRGLSKDVSGKMAGVQISNGDHVMDWVAKKLKKELQTCGVRCH